MSRLIDADVLKEDLTRFYDGEVVARRLIDEQPTVDAGSVRHGRWFYKRGGLWVCSVCDFASEAPVAFKLYKFCPNCGARMDGNGNE